MIVSTILKYLACHYTTHAKHVVKLKIMHIIPLNNFQERIQSNVNTFCKQYTK